MNLYDITSKDIQEIADTPIIEKTAQKLVKKHGVVLDRIDEKNNTINATVKTRKIHHRVRLSIVDDSLAADCDCSYKGIGCEHIVATLIKWIEKIQSLPLE